MQSDPFQGFTILTAFKTLLFLHALSVVSLHGKHKAVNVKIFSTKGNSMGLEVHIMSGAWRRLLQMGGLPTVPEALAP